VSDIFAGWWFFLWVLQLVAKRWFTRCLKAAVFLLALCFPVCNGNISHIQKKRKKYVFEETKGTSGNSEGMTNQSLAVVKALHRLKHNKQKNKCGMNKNNQKIKWKM